MVDKKEQFNGLIKISQSIVSEKYLDEILDLIVVITAEMLNSKICSIMLLDEKKESLVIRATQALSENYRKKPNVKVNQSLSGEVLKNKKPLVVYDVRQEEKYMFSELAKKEGLSSMLIAPMVVKNKAVGIINIYTKTLHKFTKEEIDIIQLVANQAAVAIENTKLMEETIKAKEALEARKVIDRAKGILMEMCNISEDAAYKLIHKKSMDSAKPMKDIAEAIILTSELKNKK
jgi:signal transduction protein with GAF and PtsI domain